MPRALRQFWRRRARAHARRVPRAPLSASTFCDRPWRAMSAAGAAASGAAVRAVSKVMPAPPRHWGTCAPGWVGWVSRVWGGADAALGCARAPSVAKPGGEAWREFLGLRLPPVARDGRHEVQCAPLTEPHPKPCTRLLCRGSGGVYEYAFWLCFIQPPALLADGAPCGAARPVSLRPDCNACRIAMHAER